MKALIIVPAFNESTVIYKVLKSIPNDLKGVSHVEKLVIDDGSTDNTTGEAIRARVQVARHVINRGVGAATKTGISWAKKKGADIIVTFDADGQHNPRDIPKVINPILNKKADIVIGSRFKRKQKVPTDRLILNWFANTMTFALFGVSSTDSQSGLRAFSRKAVELIDFKTERMEFSSEILSEAKKHNLRIIEVPTTAIYTDYSRAKGQKNTNAIPIAVRLLVKFLR